MTGIEPQVIGFLLKLVTLLLQEGAQSARLKACAFDAVQCQPAKWVWFVP